MKHRQFDPKQFVERKRFKFWSEMQRKPGESVLELAARIPRAAASSNFTAVRLITQLLIAVSKTLFVIFAKLQSLGKVCRKKAQQCTTSSVKAIDVLEVNSIANG